MIDFYLENVTQNRTMLLPITPENYSVTNDMQVETVKLASIGDINIPTFNAPQAITIEGIFSTNNNAYDFLNTNLMPDFINRSIDYVTVLNSWKNAKDIIRVLILKRGTTENRLDAKFYLKSVTIDGEYEGTGDISYSLDFVEYREVSVNNANNTPSDTENRDVNKASTPSATSNKNYTVVKGDSLWSIARKFYGNGNEYNKIVSANNIKNPNLIYPGQTFIIPWYKKGVN